ncbi:MAG: glycosyltransferase family 87 protein [Planctomycetota bacterium]
MTRSQSYDGERASARHDDHEPAGSPRPLSVVSSGLETSLRRGRVLGWVLGVLLLGFVATRGAAQPERGDTRFFQRGAARFAAREPLYKAVRSEPSSPNSGYTYPPPFALMARPTLWLSPAALRALWPWLMAACGVAGYRALRRALGARPETRALALALVLAVCGRYVWNDLRHGQTNLLVVGLVCAALAYARARRDGWAGAALGLALVIKPTAWPLGLWYLLGGRLRLVLSCGLTGLVALALPALLYGPALYLGELASWVTRMRGFALEEALSSGREEGSTLVNLAASAWGARGLQACGVADAIGGGRLLAWISGGLALGYTLWRRPRHGALACVLLGAWLSPVTWKAHLVLLALPAALAAERLLGHPTRRELGLWTVWVLLIAAPKLWPPAEVLGASTLAVALGWVWCVRSENGANPRAGNV